MSACLVGPVIKSVFPGGGPQLLGTNFGRRGRARREVWESGLLWLLGGFPSWKLAYDHALRIGARIRKEAPVRAHLSKIRLTVPPEHRGAENMAGQGTFREVTFPMGSSLRSALKWSRQAHVFLCHMLSVPPLLLNTLCLPDG